MFTFAQMQDAYEKHGDRLLILVGPGEVYSANPSDYFMCQNSTEFEGALVICSPTTYEIIVDDEE